VEATLIEAFGDGAELVLAGLEREPLAVASIGQVHRGRLEGRDVAIKVLPDDFAADRDRLRRFEREARAVASLSHPNIVVVHDVHDRLRLTHAGRSCITGLKTPAETGSVKRKVAPPPALPSAHIRPPCASTIDFEIESPRPIPRSLVV